MERCARFEALAIHLLTGVLFTLLSSIILLAAVASQPWLLAAIIPLTVGAAWGWWYQAPFFATILRGEDAEL